MGTNNRDKIFKSWSGVTEVALIKEVATKGEHIQLCLEYWSRKRKLPLEEYEPIFHDVVQTYVQRLLSEHLVCKAENVLKNVHRDVWCCYYQFACECEDVELREAILDHLRKKDPHDFDKLMEELQFHWELLQQLQSCPTVLVKCQTQMRRMNLETLMAREGAYRKRLVVEVYFINRNPALLEHLSKHIMWDFLVETQEKTEIIRWCYLSAVDNTSSTEQLQCCNDLELKYTQWPIEAEMFEFALKALKNADDVLRNCFAIAGYFFTDERDDVSAVLRRICSTESFAKNAELLEKLPIGQYLLKSSNYMLMLQNFVSTRELEELAERYQEQAELLKLICILKEHKIEEREGFEKISNSCKIFLESHAVDLHNEQPLVTFYEFLCNEPTVASLQCFLLSSALKHIPYLKSMIHHLDAHSSTNGNGNGGCSSSYEKTYPTPYDFLRKFKNIDFKEMCKDSEEVPSFSNERLCQKYARKYNLNFLHYLKQQRSSYAVYYFLMAQLQNYSQITKTQLFRACESVTELALQNSTNMDLTTHCVAFEEMLGFDTQLLRNFLKLCRLLSSTSRVSSYASLVAQVESELVQRLAQQPQTFPLAEYEAIIRIVVTCNQQLNWPELILCQYAKNDDWWCLLVLLQYFDVPLPQIKQLIEQFKTRTIGEHLLRALSYESAISSSDRSTKRHKTRRSEQQYMPTTTSVETLTSSISSCADTNTLIKCSANSESSQQTLRFLTDSTADNQDLFSIILLSTSAVAAERINDITKFLEIMQDNLSYSTAWNLMKNAVKFRLPILAVLSATVSALNVDWNWIVWLAVTTEQWHDTLQVALKNVQELSWQLIETCVRQDYTAALYRSFCIFYEQNPLVHLFKFLYQTQQLRDFGENAIHELRLYLLAWSNDEIQLPLLCTSMKREQLMQRSIKLILLHLQHNFDSTLDQHNFLSCICRSDMSDISGVIDFCLLKEVFALLQRVSGWTQKFSINFEQLLQRKHKEYEQLLTALLEAKEYDAALSLASLLHLPICDIVYSKWVAGLQVYELNAENIDFEQYEQEIVEHSLPPEVLVNFFLYAVARSEQGSWLRKYMLLKQALNVIKKHHLFPNESFDRDQIEYEMIMAYLQIEDVNILDTLDIYHSEYYEQIMLKERCVLYKSFLELKELAGIEDLSINLKSPLTEHMKIRLEALLNHLLDVGDIVEALRLQELFECRPIDLRFVVFCMALAEGVTTIFSMSPEERQFLRDIEKGSFARFNKRTLNSLRASVSQQGNNNTSASPLKSLSNELSDSCSTLEFEEIPSKEKRETLETIQGIASKLKSGVNMGKRIVMVYRAAMYLDKEYLDVLRTKDITVLLKRAAEEECMQRLLVVSDILTSTHMTAQEIANLMSYEISIAVVRPRFYIFNADQQANNVFKNANLWGYNIDRDLHLFLELVPNTTMLGYALLEYCDALKAYRNYQDNKVYKHNAVFEKLAEIINCYGLPGDAAAAVAATTAAVTAAASTALTATAANTTTLQVLSHKKQNLIYVELLIKAHQCFVHECSMEGIANVLNRAKVLNAVLAKAKSWSLVVRLLIGIARYREMFYCFDTLIENEQFESLLGQFDEEKTVGLRQAILAYLREYAPANSRELLKLAALHFLMYKDLAEIWEQDAQMLLTKVLVNAQQTAEQAAHIAAGSAGVGGKIVITKLKSTSEGITLLQQALENYTHATENYLLDNRLILAQKSAFTAEMIAMQIDLASKALTSTTHLCACVINVQTCDEFRDLINSELSVPQALILSRAYGYDINWTQALLTQYIILQKNAYLVDYLAHFTLNDLIIENIVKGFQLYAQHYKPTARMEENLAHLVQLLKSVTLKYKLASVLALKSTVMSLINEQTSYYLRDTNYGRMDNFNINNI